MGEYDTLWRVSIRYENLETGSRGVAVYRIRGTLAGALQRSRSLFGEQRSRYYRCRSIDYDAVRED